MKQRHFHILSIICLVLFLGSTHTYGQLDIQQLTEQQGLGNNTVNEIHQDRKGFMWIGTDIGLTRYDGNFFHIYNMSRPGGREPISINNIEETEDRYLWVKCEDGIIVCFDKIQEKYIPIQWEGDLKQEHIHQFYSTGNTLYALTPNGLSQLDAKPEGEVMKLDAKVLIQDKKLNMVLSGQNHILYLVDRNDQLIVYHTQTQKSETISCQEWNICSKDIQKIYPIHDYLFICGQFEGIICYHLKEKNFRQIKIDNNSSDYKQPSISEISYLKDNRFAISNKRFIYELIFEGDHYLQTNYNVHRRVTYERQYEQLIRNRINKLYYDTDNHVLWIGTYGNGLVRQNISKSYAYRIKLQENIYHINDIVQDAQGYIWLGTRNYGIQKSTDNNLTKDTRFTSWDQADKDASYHLQKDRNGNIWIGCEKGTIQKLNPSTGELTSIALPDTVKNPTEEFCVKNLFMNSRNRLWVATETSIGIYDENIGKWLVYENYHEPYGKINCIAEDAEGVMWLGTENGLYEANVPLEIPNCINMIGGFETEVGLTPNDVLSLHVTNTNQILVSYPDKIVRMDKNKIINYIVLREAIPYGHITCMIDDRNGNTWAGSNESIISIHNKTAVYFSYPMSGNNPIVCRLNDSKLLWGNMPDLLFFDPVKLKDLPRKKVHITDIEVNAQKMVLDNQAIYEAKEINLTKGDHVRLMFSKLNYNSVQNKTVYRILPTDTIWKENSQNEIVLDEIEAGEYQLEIKPVYPSPGGEEITTLKLKVSNHWVFSLWALIGYSLVIVTGGIIVYRFFHKIKEHQKLHQEKQQKLVDELQSVKDSKEMEKKQHQLRSSIQASIAQDLRTPLSIISNSLKEITGNDDYSPELKQKFKLAHRNSLYIQDACEQLINIHKQDLCKQELEVSAYPVSQITDSVIRDAREIISACPINIQYSQEKNSRQIWVDYTKIDFTIKNMLSNAFRRTHYAGNIHCTQGIEVIDGQEFCVFRISDDGKDGESIIHQSHELGLTLMKDIAKRHHGMLKIIKKTGEGTESTLYLPTGKEHFENDTDIVFVQANPHTHSAASEEALIIPVHKKEKEETTESKVPQSKFKVLIVEEHQDTRTFLKLQFANEATVYLAKDGKEGIEMAQKVLPDLIITEVALRIVDGFELTRTLKEDMETCHIPIILLTTLTNNEDIIKGMELGADDYVRKPFDIEVLMSKSKRLIKNRMELKRAYTKLLIPTLQTKEQETDENNEGNNENTEDPLVTKVLQLINENIQNEDFNVKKLAEMLNMSQPTLYRKIKQLTNFTLIEVVRGVRLKRAAELLKSKKYNVQEAAEAVGYNDIPTFRKHFVEFYGTTPSAFSKESYNDKKEESPL